METSDIERLSASLSIEEVPVGVLHQRELGGKLGKGATVVLVDGFEKDVIGPDTDLGGQFKGRKELRELHGYAVHIR
ncbi:hypothetical protein ACOSQ2_032001 [Xanthoceras sorbifolium]